MISEVRIISSMGDVRSTSMGANTTAVPHDQKTTVSFVRVGRPVRRMGSRVRSACRVWWVRTDVARDHLVHGRIAGYVASEAHEEEEEVLLQGRQAIGKVSDLPQQHRAIVPSAINSK